MVNQHYFVFNKSRERSCDCRMTLRIEWKVLCLWFISDTQWTESFSGLRLEWREGEGGQICPTTSRIIGIHRCACTRSLGKASVCASPSPILFFLFFVKSAVYLSWHTWSKFYFPKATTLVFTLLHLCAYSWLVHLEVLSPSSHSANFHLLSSDSFSFTTTKACIINVNNISFHTIIPMPIFITLIHLGHHFLQNV